MVDNQLLRNIEDWYIGFERDDDWCYEENVKVTVKANKIKEIKYFSPKQFRKELKDFLKQLKDKKLLDEVELKKIGKEYYLVAGWKKIAKIENIDKDHLKEIEQEIEKIKEEIKQELQILKTHVESNNEAVKLTWWDRKFYELEKLKKTNKELYYKALAELIIGITNEKQLNRIKKLPKQDIRQAFKTFRYNSKFFEKFLDVFYNPKAEAKCQNLDSHRCRVKVIYFYSLAKVYHLSSKQINLIEQLFEDSFSKQEVNKFLDELYQIAQDYKNYYKDLLNEDVASRIIWEKWVIGYLKTVMNRFEYWNQTAKDIVSFLAEVAPVIMGVYLLFKVITKHRWLWLAFLVEELLGQATTGTSLGEVFVKFWYWWLEREMEKFRSKDSVKVTKQSIDLIKKSEQYRNVLTSSTFVDFYLWDVKLKDLVKYVDIKNWKFVFKDFNEFLDSLSKDDPRREILIKFKQRYWVDKIDELLDSGLKNIWITPENFSQLVKQEWDKSINDFLNVTIQKLRDSQGVLDNEVNKSVGIHQISSENLDDKNENQDGHQSWEDRIKKQEKLRKKSEHKDRLKSSSEKWLIERWFDKIFLVDEKFDYFEKLLGDWYGELYFIVRAIQYWYLDPNKVKDRQSIESEWLLAKMLNKIDEWLVIKPINAMDKTNSVVRNNLGNFYKFLSKKLNKKLIVFIDKDLEVLWKYLQHLNKQVENLGNVKQKLEEQKQLLQQMKQVINQNDSQKFKQLLEKYIQNFDNTFISRFFKHYKQKKLVWKWDSFTEVVKKFEDYNLKLIKWDIFEVKWQNNELYKLKFEGIEKGELKFILIGANWNVIWDLKSDKFEDIWLQLKRILRQKNVDIKEITYLENEIVENFRFNKMAEYISKSSKKIEEKIDRLEETNKIEELQNKAKDILKKYDEEVKKLLKIHKWKIPDSEKEAIIARLNQEMGKINDEIVKLNLSILKKLQLKSLDEIKKLAEKDKIVDILVKLNSWAENFEQKLAKSRTFKGVMWFGLIMLLWHWWWALISSDEKLKMWIDLGVGFIPFVGNAWDWYWAVKWIDPVSWEEMPTGERILRWLFAIPFVWNIAKFVWKWYKLYKISRSWEKVWKFIENVDKSSKWIEKVEEISKTYDKFLRFWTYWFLWVEAVASAFDLGAFVGKTMGFGVDSQMFHKIE